MISSTNMSLDSTSKKKHFYLTTTLPYVNSDPHIGFAMEIIRADVVARHKKSLGLDVFLNTGTDEHGAKIERKAKEAGIPVQQYVDSYAEKFKNLKELLGLSPDLNFIRTTDAYHVKAAQEFWKRCNSNGFIYKKAYKIKYCVGCELEKTDSELVDGKCPIHPNQEIELIEEENYFFKFSAFQKPLLDFYAKNPDFVIPDFRYNEIKAFVERGLEDFSISRLKSKMSWGVDVPGDSEHVMYVWFDALVSYISAIGWPEDIKKFETWWPVTQYCGKDNLRQQSAMWQAMLMAAGLPNSRQIVIDGFITSGGQKMSKSLGNVISPFDVVKEYGADALRYFAIRELHPFEDSDFTMERFKESYNGNLANGLGNLVSRVMRMAVDNQIFFDKTPFIELETLSNNDNIFKKYKVGLENFNLAQSMDAIWDAVAWSDRNIQSSQPFRGVKSSDTQVVQAAKENINILLGDLYQIGIMLRPFMPETSLKIQTLVLENKVPTQPLFMRKD